MSLCFSDNASSDLQAAMPPRVGFVERVRRLLVLPPVAAEGELMPAPTRADVLRMVSTRPSKPRRPTPRDDINALLL